MTNKTEVKFLKDWKYAHAGIHVVAYAAGATDFLGAEALKAALADKVAEIVDAAGTSLVDLAANLEKAALKTDEVTQALAAAKQELKVAATPAQKEELKGKVAALGTALGEAKATEKEAESALTKAEKEAKKQA